MKQYPVGFAVAYAIVGATALAALVLGLLTAFTPATPVAHKSDIQNALGATQQKTLLLQAEQAIAKEGANEGLTVTSQKLLKVKNPDSDTVVFVIRATTAEFGPITIDVTFHKGIYQISGLAAE